MNRQEFAEKKHDLVLALSALSYDTVLDASAAVLTALRSGGTIFTMGCGGSAADASHLTAELIGRFEVRGRVALPSVCLNTDTSVMTALANDFGFDTVFARQIEAIATPADLVIAFSTSGSSPVIVKAIETARSKTVRSMLITSDRCVADIADITVRIASSSTPRIQEMHTFVVHSICEFVDRHFVLAAEPTT